MNPEITKAVEELQRVRDQMKVEPFRKQMDELISFYSLYGNLAVVSDIIKLSGPDATVAVEAGRKLQELKGKVDAYFTGFNTGLNDAQKTEFFKKLLSLTQSDASLSGVSGDIQKIVDILGTKSQEHSLDKSIKDVVDPKIAQIIAEVFRNTPNKSDILTRIKAQKANIEELQKRFLEERNKILENSRQARETPLFWVDAKNEDGWYNWFWRNVQKGNIEIEKIEPEIMKIFSMQGNELKNYGLKMNLSPLKIKGGVEFHIPTNQLDQEKFTQYYEGLDQKSKLRVHILGTLFRLGTSFSPEIIKKINASIDSDSTGNGAIQIIQSELQKKGTDPNEIIKIIAKLKNQDINDIIDTVRNIVGDSFSKEFESLKSQLKDDLDTAKIFGREVKYRNVDERNKALISTMIFIKSFSENGESWSGLIMAYTNMFIKYATGEVWFKIPMPEAIEKFKKNLQGDLFGLVFFLLFNTGAIAKVWQSLKDKEQKKVFDKHTGVELQGADIGSGGDLALNRHAERNRLVEKLAKFFEFVGDETTKRKLDAFQRNSRFASLRPERFYMGLYDHIYSASPLLNKVLGVVFTPIRPIHNHVVAWSDKVGIWGSAIQRVQALELAIDGFNKEWEKLVKQVQHHPLLNSQEKDIVDKAKKALKEQLKKGFWEGHGSFLEKVLSTAVVDGNTSPAIEAFRSAGLPALDQNLIDFMESADEKVTPERVQEEMEKAQRYVTKEYNETGNKKTSPRQARIDVLEGFREAVIKGLANPVDGWVGTMSELKARIFMIVDPTRDPTKYMETPESWKNAKTGTELITLIAQEGDKLPTIESNTLISEGREKGKNSAIYRELTVWEKLFEYQDKPDLKAKIGHLMEAVLKGDVNGLSGLSLTSPADFRASLGTMFGVDIATLPTEVELDSLLGAKGTPDALLKEFKDAGNKFGETTLFRILMRYELYFDIEGDELKRRAISRIYDGIVDGDMTKLEGVKFNSPAVLEASLKTKIGFTGEVLPSSELARKIVTLGNSPYIDLGLTDRERLEIEKLKNKAQQQRLATELLEKGKIRTIVIENIAEVLKHAIRK